MPPPSRSPSPFGGERDKKVLVAIRATLNVTDENENLPFFVLKLILEQRRGDGANHA